MAFEKEQLSPKLYSPKTLLHCVLEEYNLTIGTTKPIKAKRFMEFYNRMVA